MICVFLFSARYLLLTSFFRISALVAEVPIPLPLICALSSSSSISCPAFSIARIIDPELYRFGGEVSPSFIEKPFPSIISFFFREDSIFNKFSSQAVSVSSSCSFSFVFSASSVFLPKLYCFSSRYPALESTLKLAKNCSLPRCTQSAIFW